MFQENDSCNPRKQICYALRNAPTTSTRKNVMSLSRPSCSFARCGTSIETIHLRHTCIKIQPRPVVRTHARCWKAASARTHRSPLQTNMLCLEQRPNKGNTHKLLCRCLARCGNSAETIHLRHTSVKIPRLVDALWRECTRGAGKQPLP